MSKKGGKKKSQSKEVTSKNNTFLILIGKKT
jgi:hypothetical protein